MTSPRSWFSRFSAPLLVVAVSLFFVAHAQAQSGRWTAHTSLRQVQALSVSDEAVWAATSGGVFSFAPGTGEFERYTAVDDLHSVETRAIAYDPRRSVVWIGYQDGVLDRLDVASGAVVSFRDIERAGQFTSRGINRIVVQGDSLLVATAFGLVIFDPVRQEVRDTYSRLGPLPPSTPVNDVVVAPGPDGAAAFWLATGQGMAYASLRTPNLQDPTAWTAERDGLPGPDAEAQAVAALNGRLYVGTIADLYLRTDSGTYAQMFVTGSPVSRLYVSGGRLFGVERFRALVVEPSGVARRLEMGEIQHPVDLILGPQGSLWIGDTEAGLVEAVLPGEATTQLTILRTTYPDGPFEGQFTDLAFDEAGNLWAGGTSGAGRGFYRRDAEGLWTSFTERNYDILLGRNTYTRIFVDGENRAWAGSEGDGLALVERGDNVQVFDHQNSSLLPATGTSDFIIAGGITSDEDGRIWVSTRASARPLHVRDTDGTWTALPPLLGQGLSSTSTAYDRLYIDAFEQIWIIVRDERSLGNTRGLAVLDVGATPTDPTDDVFRFWEQKGGSGQGLPSRTVTSVIEDREGRVWIGTDGGLAYFINTGIVAADPSAQAIWPPWADRTRGTFVLFGLRINDLAVDPANRLWVASNEGAWLLQEVEGGWDLVEHWTTDNAPLFSDEIVSVAVDARTGEVYFATDQGLISYEGDAIAPAQAVQDLFVYPNPVRVQEGAVPDIFIEGLVEETEVRILAPHGGLVARLSARGGRARWDGRDLNQRVVSSGIYLVVAVGQNGEGTAYGKVAVIR